MAGLIVGVIAIPLAIAFGISSGVCPTEGLVTAIIAGFIISALGGTRVQIGGLTGAFIIIIYGIIQQYGLSGLAIATIENLHIPDGVEVYEIDGPYFFGIANKFDDMICLSRTAPKVRVIRMRKVPFVDSTGLHNLEMLCERSQRSGTTVVLSGVRYNVKETLVNAGFAEKLGYDNICPNINAALSRASVLAAEGVTK